MTPSGTTPPSPVSPIRPFDRHRRAFARWIPRRRAALGISDQAAPSLLFVAVGMLIGPAALAAISPTMLAQLDPVVSVALAVLGVFIGSGVVGASGARKARWIAGAVAEATLTLTTVGLAFYLLLLQWGPPLPVAPLEAAVLLGICAAASAAVHVEPVSEQTFTASHLADLDDLPVVVLGSIVVSALAVGPGVLGSLGLALASGTLIAAAGALLFRRARGAPERLVFVIGTVILLGGAAAYASASPLATGCIAGVLWAAGGGGATPLHADLRKVQHPLVALLLIVAGASIQFSSLLLWIAAPLVLFRLTGKLLGGMVVARVLRLPGGLLATVLAPPGVLGIAVALNVQQVLGTGDTVLVSAVTVATAASELLATSLLPSEEQE